LSEDSSRSFIADLKPLILSPIPLPSSGGFLGPNTSKAIPKTNNSAWAEKVLQTLNSLLGLAPALGSPSLPCFGSSLLPSFLQLRSRITATLDVTVSLRRPDGVLRESPRASEFSAATPFLLIACSFPKAALPLSQGLPEFFGYASEEDYLSRVSTS